MLPQIYDYDYQYRKLEKRTSFFNQVDRQISESLICSLCKEVFIDPVQIECGCRFCFSCVSDNVNHNLICPECHLEISKNSFLKDKAIEKEIFMLSIKCINDGCPHICLLRDLKKHLEICEYKLENCERCQESYHYYSKEEHFTKLCRKLIVKCDDCDLEMTKEDLELKHRNIEIGLEFLCLNLKGSCPYQCSNEIHQNIKSHMMKCSYKPTHCPLADLGCDIVGTSDEISKHLQDSLPNHQILMMNEIIRLRMDNENLQKLFVLMNEKSMEEIKFIKSINEELINNIEKLELKEIDSLRDIESIKSELNLYKKTDSTPNAKNILHVENEVCTWVIADIKHKYQEARSGNQIKIISEPFYLSKPGYKMLMKVYPNGDGRGKDKFLSIYFVIAKGEYDDLIRWPFDYRVNMIIVSSNPSSPDLTVRMMPDRNELCYGKPTSEFNVGAGQPEFIQLSDFLATEDYIHDGSLQIKLSLQANKNTNSYQNLRRNSSKI